jgi:hypothetical protein
MMTLQQTVEIPADHRLHLDCVVPQEIPEGTTTISLTFNGFDDEASLRRRHARYARELSLKEQERLERENAIALAACRKSPSLVAMRGSCKGLDTMEAYFARKQADKEKERLQERRYQ